jgi:hypothetical protein
MHTDPSITSIAMQVSTIDRDENDPLAPPKGMPWKWYLLTLNFCPGRFFRISTFKDGRVQEISTIGGPFHRLNKWKGGVLSEDGRMFCMPPNCPSVLQFKGQSLCK